MTIFEWCDKNPSCYLSFTYVKDKVRVCELDLLTFKRDLSDEDLKDPSFIPFLKTVEKNKNIKIQINKHFMPARYQIYMSCGSLNYAHVISLKDAELSDMHMYMYLIMHEGITSITNVFLGRDK